MYEPPTTVSISPAYLTVYEAAALLRIDHTTLRRWIRRKMLSVSQPGGRKGNILIRKEEVDRLLTKYEKKGRQ